MNTPMDIEALALKREVEIFMSNEFKTLDNKNNYRNRILCTWEKLNSVPITEFSEPVWDDLNDNMQNVI